MKLCQLVPGLVRAREDAVRPSPPTARRCHQWHPAVGGDLPACLDALVRYGSQLLVASLALLAVGSGCTGRSRWCRTAVGGVILYVGTYQ